MDGAAIALRRDVRVISLIGFGHFFSHFYQLALAPLFIMIHNEMGFSFTELGILIGVFYAASAFFQPPAGFLIDRFGARLALLGGLAVMAISFIGYGFLPSYPVMVALSLLSGLGNSVFHPADYSILSATVKESRIGWAFSAHNLFGFLGYASAPLLMVWVAHEWGWRSAVISAGIAGLIAVVALAAGSGDFRDSTHERKDLAENTGHDSFGDGIHLLLQAPVLLCFLFFALVAMGQIGLQNFSPTILASNFKFDQGMANGVITALLLGVPIGIIAGGYIANNTTRHDAIIAICFGLAAGMVLVAGFAPLSIWGVLAAYCVAGMAYGTAFPSRDVVVRSIAPRTGTGKVFGFVYAGLDTGSAVTPVVFGWLVDHDLPLGMFICVAGLWLTGAVVVIVTGRVTSGQRTASAT
jgi:MFS transporter, FSR family, fosmidomycin resistance protein